MRPDSTGGLDAAFTAFAERRARHHLRTAVLLTGDWHAAEDLVQTCLVKLYRVWHRLDTRADPDGYLRRMLINTHRSWWRVRWRREAPVAAIPDRPIEVDGQDRHALAETVRRALGVLPQRQRAALVLRFFEDLPEAQVAELLDFGKLALENPQGALDLVRSAGDVREAGPLAGDGWSGVRYAFTLTDRDVRLTGTVDVDTDGRVRRLEFTSRSSDTAHGVAGTLRAELTFRDFGARERVTVPPADQVFKLPDPEDRKRELEQRRRAARRG